MMSQHRRSKVILHLLLTNTGGFVSKVVRVSAYTDRLRSRHGYCHGDENYRRQNSLNRKQLYQAMLHLYAVTARSMEEELRYGSNPTWPADTLRKYPPTALKPSGFQSPRYLEARLLSAPCIGQAHAQATI